jgi:hypothetical protein
MTSNEPAVPPESRQVTNAMSVVALCLGIIPIFVGLLGVIFGFIALHQIKKRGGQRGRGLALTGIIAGFGWMLILGAGIAIYVYANVTGSAGGDTISVEVGQCFTTPPGSNVGGITIVDCSKPHTDQAYAEYEVSGSTYPGDSAMQADATKQCLALGQTKVDQSNLTSTMDSAILYPSAQDWSDQNRTVTCLIEGTDGSTWTGSILVGPQS